MSAQIIQLRAPKGEIRVRTRIVNAVDEANRPEAKRGKAKIRSYEADALVDVGAVRTVISARIATRLGTEIRGQRIVEYADGRKESVGVTGPLVIEIQGRDTLEEALVLGNEVLIGQTVLEKLDLLADCANRRLIPNPAHPDGPVTKVK